MKNAQILYDALSNIMYSTSDRDGEHPLVRLLKIQQVTIDAVVEYDNAEIETGRETGWDVGTAYL